MVSEYPGFLLKKTFHSTNRNYRCSLLDCWLAVITGGICWLTQVVKIYWSKPASISPLPFQYTPNFRKNAARTFSNIFNYNRDLSCSFPPSFGLMASYIY
uniref:Uncharacterized protein n=1 Tax=Pseudonaja textilis TaxID=8673 RepID=A0A670YLB5_PSETE